MKLIHLLQISDLNKLLVENLVHRAQVLNAKLNAQGYGSHQGITLVNLFYENSTRTRVSFELAARRLGMEAININLNTSSMQKGETILDTVANLKAMQCHIFAIRHSQEHVPATVAAHIGESAHVINAGDGCNEHPTQALLDMLTIYQHHQNIADLSVGIIGDIAHSRVANSDIAALKLLGCHDIRLIGPQHFLPQTHTDLPRFTHLEPALTGLDVVITLRVQQERIKNLADLNLQEYCHDYCLTATKLALAKPNAIVMHPGPVNREVEITSEVVDGPKSVVLQQTHNGVAMRMAILERLMSSSNY